MQQAVLNSLNRLSDGHTRRSAWNELTVFAERLDAQKLPGFLACLHATNDRYTLACRRGAVQLYGRLGGMHPRLLPPHLPKIADYVVARLRDKDSTRELREACAAALGALVADLGPDAAPVVLRYLLPVLGESLEPVQLGGGLCLACVVTSAGELPPPLVARACQALHRPLLGHCCVGAHAAMLDAAAALLKHSPLSTAAHASALLSPLISACGSSDWGTRRAAADALLALVAHHPRVVQVRRSPRALLRHGLRRVSALDEACPAPLPPPRRRTSRA